jgi:hypothetical protein
MNNTPPCEGESRARLLAELQAVAIGIRLFGLDRLPEVMGSKTIGAMPALGGLNDSGKFAPEAALSRATEASHD